MKQKIKGILTQIFDLAEKQKVFAFFLGAIMLLLVWRFSVECWEVEVMGQKYTYNCWCLEGDKVNEN